MKQIVIKVPDNKHDFFLELIKNPGFEQESGNEYILTAVQKSTRKHLNSKAEEPGAATWGSVKEKKNDTLSRNVPKWHKDLVKKRIALAKTSGYISWDKAKKQIKSKGKG